MRAAPGMTRVGPGSVMMTRPGVAAVPPETRLVIPAIRAANPQNLMATLGGMAIGDSIRGRIIAPEVLMVSAPARLLVVAAMEQHRWVCTIGIPLPLHP